MQGLWMKSAGGFFGLFVGSLDGTNFAAVDGGRGGARGGERGAGGGPPVARGIGGFPPPQDQYTPEAAEEKKDRQRRKYEDPEAHCHLPGVPRGLEQPAGLYPVQIIQDEKYFALLHEYPHDARIIPTDNSRHPQNYWAWDGDSRGHWEGDTLVVDVTNFNGRTWLDMEGNFVDENEHVIERFTLVDADTILYEATIIDPTVFTKPVHERFTLKRVPKEQQLLEVQLSRRRAKPSALHRRRRRDEAEAEMTVAGWLRFAVAAAIGAVAVTTGPVTASQLAKSTAPYSPPRLWDGKTPDFRGIWQVRDTAYVNIEGHRGEKEIAPARSIIVDPSDGKVPYRSDALPRRLSNYKNRATADPSLRCAQAGVPRATYLPFPLQILQSPGNLAIVYQENHAIRLFYPESREHFDRADWWMGDTRYRWEGDVLVADVVALTGQLWFDQTGNYHSDDVHVVERYTMTGPDTLRYEARIDDEAVYTKPWTLRTLLYRIKDPGARIIEDECLEDENGVRHHISPTDPRSLKKSDYSRWKTSR